MARRKLVKLLGLVLPGAPVRLIDFQNAAGHPDIGPLEFGLEIIEMACGDAVIFRA